MRGKERERRKGREENGCGGREMEGRKGAEEGEGERISKGLRREGEGREERS